MVPFANGPEKPRESDSLEMSNVIEIIELGPENRSVGRIESVRETIHGSESDR